MTENARLALQTVSDYAEREADIALNQAEQCKQYQDFRAMDRHASYAEAMRKIVDKIGMARQFFLPDVVSTGQQPSNRRDNENA